MDTFYKYKLHLLPNGEICTIDYELKDDQSNSLEIFLQKLEIKEPKLSRTVRKGQLLDSDHSEITPEFFPTMSNDADLYLVLHDLESMFKLVI